MTVASGFAACGCGPHPQQCTNPWQVIQYRDDGHVEVDRAVRCADMAAKGSPLANGRHVRKLGATERCLRRQRGSVVAAERVDAKNGIVGNNRFERRDRSIVGDREVPSAAGCDLAPCLKNWCALTQGNLG